MKTKILSSVSLVLISLLICSFVFAQDEENFILKRHEKWLDRIMVSKQTDGTRQPVKPLAAIPEVIVRIPDNIPPDGPIVTKPDGGNIRYLVVVTRDHDFTKNFSNLDEAMAYLQKAVTAAFGEHAIVGLYEGGKDGTIYACDMGQETAPFTYDVNADGTITVYMKNELNPPIGWELEEKIQGPCDHPPLEKKIQGPGLIIEDPNPNPNSHLPGIGRPVPGFNPPIIEEVIPPDPTIVWANKSNSLISKDPVPTEPVYRPYNPKINPLVPTVEAPLPDPNLEVLEQMSLEQTVAAQAQDRRFSGQMVCEMRSKEVLTLRGPQ